MGLKRYVSLFYVLDYEPYTDTLYRIVQDHLMTPTTIRSWLLNPHTFELFKQQLVIDHFDSDAVNGEDWIKYVAENDCVVQSIQEWNTLLL